MLTVTLEEWPARLEAARAGIPVRIEGVFRAAAARAEREAKLRLASGVRNVRSGRLRRSVVGSFDRGSGEVSITLSAGGSAGGKEVRYARIQEKGGIVRPKNAKMLAIPVGPALTPSGVARYSSPREVPGLELVRSRSGAFLLVKHEDGQINGKGRKIRAGTVYFVLKRQIRITGVPYLKPSLDAVAVTIPGEVLSGVREVLGGQ